jgi:hypothetical protein
VATVTIPAIPATGAVGFLVIGGFAEDSLASLPSSLVLPAGYEGVLYGDLVISMNGLIGTGMNIILSQEFNGHSMLNLLFSMHQFSSYFDNACVSSRCVPK